MATAIEVPAGVPCPQTSAVMPEDGRLLSDAARAPREARTVELDERQYQTFTFTFNEEQAAAFRDWWRGPLIEGGAWFSAPETWPQPEGLLVKVRRFIDAPAWQYIGVGVWRVAIDAEVRGETLLPNEPEEGGATTEWWWLGDPNELPFFSAGTPDQAQPWDETLGGSNVSTFGADWGASGFISIAPYSVERTNPPINNTILSQTLLTDGVTPGVEWTPGPGANNWQPTVYQEPGDDPGVWRVDDNGAIEDWTGGTLVISNGPLALVINFSSQASSSSGYPQFTWEYQWT